jgi:hypothetical protein
MKVFETSGGILVAQPPEVVKSYDWCDAKWHRYIGNSHRSFEPEPGLKIWGGPIKFHEHFGKPLSDKLWHDIHKTRDVNRLLIFTTHMEEWCMGFIGRGYTLRVDADDNYNLTEIDFFQ